jgi:hypothetical protein
MASIQAIADALRATVLQFYVHLLFKIRTVYMDGHSTPRDMANSDTNNDRDKQTACEGGRLEWRRHTVAP